MNIRYPVIFVGAGPGDPELITVKGQRALMQADVIIYAGSLVPPAVLQWKNPNAVVRNSASMHLSEIITSIEDAYLDGKRTVRLHTGDPSLYGAIFEQMIELKKRKIPFRIIPGVTAAFAASAALGIEYTLPEITQTLIFTRMEGKTPVPEKEKLAKLAQHQASMVIYLSSGLVDEMAPILAENYGPDAPCVIAHCVSQPEEKLIWTTVRMLPEVIREARITRQALIIIGKTLEPGQETPVSKLYDKNFSHGYREAVKEVHEN